MNTTETTILNATPPRLFSTLIKGFNIVAGQVHLVLIPFLLDLFLWLGPKLRVHDLLTPLFQNFTASMLKIAPANMLDALKTTTDTYTQFLEQFNLFNLIRTFPIGVPSLISRLTSIDTPIQLFGVYETPSLRVGIAILGGLLMVGFFLGAVYFNSLSRFSLQDPEKFTWKKLFSQYTQSLIFFIVLVALLVIVSVPLTLLLSLVSLFSAGLAQLVIFGLIFLVMWMALPLVFTPHGIFALDQKVVPSMLLSIRMVRFFLPGTSLFIIVCILISEGLNMLWTLPGTASWLTIIGIGGHAFIVTALLIASFLYYREGLTWMQFNIQKMNAAIQKQENGGTPIE